MKLQELLLFVLVGWTLIGIAGVTLSQVRALRGIAGERERVRTGLGWMVSLWVVYMAVLLGVSREQKQKIVPLGQEQCYGEMCFTVTKVEEMPRFLGTNNIGDGSRLVRVTVAVRNKGHEKMLAERLIDAYLVDGQGRVWERSLGVGGNGLRDRVGPGQSVVSEPVFKVAADATGLGLVFTHGGWQPRVLEIGDSDSLFHKRTMVVLGRVSAAGFAY